MPSPREIETRMISTGEEQIGQAVSRLGAVGFGIAKDIYNAENVLEHSTMQNQLKEIGEKELNSLEGVWDIDEQEKIYNQALNKMKSLKSKREIVNNQFAITLNEYISRFNVSYNDVTRRSRILKMKDDLEINDQSDYLSFDEERFITRQYSSEKIGLQTPEMTDWKIKNFRVNSVLIQANRDIRLGNLDSMNIEIIQNPEFLKTLSIDQLEKVNSLQRMAKQAAQINTDAIQNEITFGMFENRAKTLDERDVLGLQYINKLKTTPGLSAESARVMTNRIEDWMRGKERTNDSLVYTKLFRDITQLHRGIGKAEQIRNSIVGAYPNLDDSHFESLNKYLDETVEEWNADILRRLEKEAIPHLAPRLSMLERFIEMSVMPGISALDKAKYDSLIERLQEPAKVDADRLALYLNQCRKWIAANPTAPNLYEQGKSFRATFERYTDDQIRQMEKQLESEAMLGTEIPKTIKTWKYTIINKKTGQRMGSDDGLQWQPIQ